MNGPGSEGRRFNWQWPLTMTLAASVAFLSLLLWNSGGDLLYILFVVPVVVLICIVLFIVSAIRGNRRLVLSTSLALVGFIAVSGVLLKNERALRPWLRWLLWSRRYKAQLFAQPGAAGGGLKHTVATYRPYAVWRSNGTRSSSTQTRTGTIVPVR
jgi:hypothetical protein